MPALKRITNSNPNVEDKVNYFIDRFSHTNLYGGHEWTFELENQLSLIDKINFQMAEKNYKRGPFSTYFNHELLTHADLWKEYPAYINVIEVIKEYNGADKKKRDLVLARESFQQDLQQLQKELREKMPETLFQSLMSVINCPYPLQEHDHIEKLNLIARLIVSEGYFSGKTVNEINEVIDRIFYKDLNEFPFPEEVEPDKKKEYLEQNNLIAQLSGFKSIMQSDPKTGIVLMKAYGGCTFPADFKFIYNNVYFFGSGHPQIQKIKKSIKDKEWIDEFFSSEDYVFVAASLRYFSIKQVHGRMKSEVKNQLEFLSVSVNRQLQIDDTKNFLVLDTNWKYLNANISGENYNRSYRTSQLSGLKNNTIKFLSRITESPGKDWLLRYEHLFIQAFKNQSISQYWQYLEALLPKDKDDNAQIRDILSEILLLNEKWNTKYRVFQTMINTLDIFYGGHDLLNISYAELPKIRKSIAKMRMPAEVRLSNYPFLIELVRDNDSKYDINYFHKAKAFYEMILIEAHAMRNFDMHAGFQNDKSVIKVQRSLHRMVIRLRILIMDEIKANPDLSFNLIIQKLREKVHKTMERLDL